MDIHLQQGESFNVKTDNTTKLVVDRSNDHYLTVTAAKRDDTLHVLTDPLNNLNNVYASAGPVQVVTNQNSRFGGDEWRVNRKQQAAASLTWSAEGLQQFEVEVWHWPGEEDLSHCTFSAQDDDKNDLNAGLAIKPFPPLQDGWQQYIYILENLPKDTHYITLHFPETSRAWTPHIGHVTAQARGAAWIVPDKQPTPDPMPLPPRRTLGDLFDGITPHLGVTLGKLRNNWDDDFESATEQAQMIYGAGARWARFNASGSDRQGTIGEGDKFEIEAMLEAGFRNFVLAYFPVIGRKDKTVSADNDKHNLERYLNMMQWFYDEGIDIQIVQYGNEWWLQDEQPDARTPSGNERVNNLMLDACAKHKAHFHSTLFGMFSLVFTHFFHRSHKSGNYAKVEVWPDVYDAVDVVPVQPYGHTADLALLWFDDSIKQFKTPIDKVIVTETWFDHGEVNNQGTVKARGYESQAHAKAGETAKLTRGLWERIGNRLVLGYCAAEPSQNNKPSIRGYGMLQITSPRGDIVPFEPEYSTLKELAAETVAKERVYVID